MFVACGVDLDGVSYVSNVGNDIYFLSDYVDSDNGDGIYHHTSVVEKNIKP